MAKADSVMVSKALRRDFDAPMLAAVFTGWPVETCFKLSMEASGMPPTGVMDMGKGSWADV